MLKKKKKKKRKKKRQNYKWTPSCTSGLSIYFRLSYQVCVERFCNGLWVFIRRPYTHHLVHRNYVITHTHTHTHTHTVLFQTVWGFLDMIPDITIKVHFYSKRPPVITSLLGQVLVSHSPAISPSRTTHGKGMQLQTRGWKQKHMLVAIRRNMSPFFL